MSVAEISDVQLDRLLGQVQAPQAPSPDLADRIVARSTLVPQARAQLFRLPRRHGPRRRPAVWGLVIAANVMAAAAAAASWDGKQFDFHRLADLPHRVAAAISIGHHRTSDRLNGAREQARPAQHLAPAHQRVAMSATEAPVGHLAAGPDASHPMSAPSVQGGLHVHGIVRAAKARPHALSGKPLGSTRPVLSKAQTLNRHSIRVKKPIEKIDHAIEARRGREAQRPRTTARPPEQSERSVSSAEPKEFAAGPGSFERAPENIRQPRQAPERLDARRENFERGGERRWRSQFFNRMRPRERRNRFRRRF